MKALRLYTHTHTHTHTHTSSLTKREKNNCKNQAQMLYGSIFGMQKQKSQSAITLIALVITIIVLLILAGVTISTLSGENGLLSRVSSARQAQIQAEAKEQLTLALQDLQVEKLGAATLDDVTQECIDNKITDYECTLTEDASISGKKVKMTKSGITCKYIIDENLQIIELTNDSSLEFTYEATSRTGNTVKILIKVVDTENGISKIEFPNPVDTLIIEASKQKQEIAIDFNAEIGTEYKFKITTVDGKETEKTILIENYYQTITKTLSEGITIDNTATKTVYNKPYTATLTTADDYIIDTLTVTMGGTSIVVDKGAGIINIETVTGDIEITATAKKLELQIGALYIGASTTVTNSASSVADNSQTKGTTLYINFTATLEGQACTITLKEDITKTVPYAITSNGTYTFEVNGTYAGKAITKDVEVKVAKYQAASNLVQYDAGDWTEEEIKTLNTSKLYDINISHTLNSTYKLNSESGLNFTFGGFTYKGDTANQSSINSGTVVTSRNQSVSPQSGYGTTKYDGWQILESTQQDGKTFVTKLIHAGTPENFVYYYTTSYDAYRAEYLLSNGERQTGYSTLSNGTKINPRNWDMYKDKTLDEKGYIQDVHCLDYTEALAITGDAYDTTGARSTGAYYWLASANTNTTNYLWDVYHLGGIGSVYLNGCRGIRPVVTLTNGVYIASGDGTEESPYVLGKD